MWNIQHILVKVVGDFSGGPVVENLPANAGDAGLIPGRGTGIPCAAGQLGPSTVTTEHSRARAPQLGSPRVTTKDPVCLR